MIDNQSSNSAGFNRNVSNILLFFLLIIRVTDQYLPIWLFGAKPPTLYDNWYVSIVYILTIIFVWLNRDNLEKVNIDKSFIVLLLVGGCVWLLYIPSGLGLLAFFVVVYAFWAFYNKLFTFRDRLVISKFQIWILLLFSSCTPFFPVLYYKLTIKHALDVEILISTFLETQLVLVIFEEVLFRGAIWGFLKQVGFSDRVIIFVQALFFWISHHNYLGLQNPYLFWVSIPLNAILFGIMTWRSKSLTPSTISHALYNFLTLLIIKTMF